MNKKEQRELEMKNRIKIIKEFAEKMDYEISVHRYKAYGYGRPCKSIELIGTIDSEGNPFSWAWYLDTFEEF